MTNTSAGVATSFLPLAAEGRIGEAYDTCVAPEMRHHDPSFAGDAASLRAAMEENHRDYPDKLLEVQRTVSGGDLVTAHSRVRMTPEDRGLAVIYIIGSKPGVLRKWGTLRSRCRKVLPMRMGCSS